MLLFERSELFAKEQTALVGARARVDRRVQIADRSPVLLANPEHLSSSAPVTAEEHAHHVRAFPDPRLETQRIVDTGLETRAFIKAYRALPSFRGDSAFYTWLYRIAINTAKNHLLAQSRRPPGGDIDAGDAEQFAGDSGLKEYATPERLLLRDEIQATINSAIEALPEDLKTAIILRELEGLSYEEIARTMDCPIGTVRSRIFRAREAIEKRLQPLLG
ncbi:MAG TPA: RNA polymerase sigma factor RpoE [Arenicellales bacterium]|nr:RNA polymerase sigma factor RpoE [Arenicellales bacterium]